MHRGGGLFQQVRGAILDLLNTFGSNCLGNFVPLAQIKSILKFARAREQLID